MNRRPTHRHVIGPPEARRPRFSIFSTNLQLTLAHVLGTLGRELGSRWTDSRRLWRTPCCWCAQAGWPGCGNSASGLTTGTTTGRGRAGCGKQRDPWRDRLRWLGRLRARKGAVSISTPPSSGRPISPTRPSNRAPDQLGKGPEELRHDLQGHRRPGLGRSRLLHRRKGTEIKADLQRHLAGDFTPKLPQPKKVETCGFFGCAPAASRKSRSTPRRCSEEHDRSA